MRTTAPSDVPPYVGVDLTDPTCRAPRPSDVCGLRPRDGALHAELWSWVFDPPDAKGRIDVSALLPEIRAARGVVIDGPQALAASGASLRACERALGTPGRTPDRLSRCKGPFAGFVHGSVRLFAAIHAARVPISAAHLVGCVAEQYPGDTWRRLAGPLPRKSTAAGLLARRRLLEALGVVFPSAPAITHDHLDAALGAMIAAAHDGRVPGLATRRVGTPLHPGVPLREGEILVLEPDAPTRARLERAVHAVAPRAADAPSGSQPHRAASRRRQAASRTGAIAIQVVVSQSMIARATPALAVAGLAHLEARANARVRLDLGVDGELVLGDTTMFWRAHQNDRTHDTYKRLHVELSARVGEPLDLQVLAIEPIV